MCKWLHEVTVTSYIDPIPGTENKHFPLNLQLFNMYWYMVDLAVKWNNRLNILFEINYIDVVYIYHF